MENGHTSNGFESNARSDAADHARDLVRQVHDELRQLLAQRAEVIRRIGTTKRTILGLAALFGGHVLSEELRHLLAGDTGGGRTGLTKACRATLIEAGHAMSAREVLDRLQEQTPAVLAGNKAPMSSVTTSLNRLVHYSEVQRIVLSDGRCTWRWSAEPTTPESEDRHLR